MLDAATEHSIAPRLVEVPSWNPFLIKDLPVAGEPPTFSVQAELYAPSNPVCAPAIVFSQGLGGVRDPRERRYARWFAELGYVGLVIDSFKSRGTDQHPEPMRALEVSESMILSDAYAGLRYLAAHAEVNPARIYIVGFSYGGMISVLSAHEQFSRVFLPDGLRFAGHVSLYGCTVPRLENVRTSGAPVTIMQGGKDGNVDLERSREIAADLRRGGSQVNEIVFPNAFHQWDSAETKRSFVQFNIAACRMHVSADGTIRDERSGMLISGGATRTLAITMSASPRGYYMRRDDEIRRRSDDILLKALSE